MVTVTQKFLVRAATLHPLLRLEKEIEMLENAGMAPAITKENTATPSPAKEAQKAEVVLNSRQVRRVPGAPSLLWPDFRSLCIRIPACHFLAV